MESDQSPQTEKNGAIELEGIIAYGGTTKMGKTYLAKSHFMELVEDGYNGLVIDSQGVENFDEIEHVSAREIFPKLWAKREPDTVGNVVAWTPTGDKDREDSEYVNLALGVIRESNRKVGPLVVLVDECSFWKNCAEFKMLCRTWRHAKVTLLLTSQHLSADMGQVVFGCNPQLVIFRSTAPRSLEFLAKWHDLDPAEIRALPEREYILRRF
jgi:hypothetical protein